MGSQKTSGATQQHEDLDLVSYTSPPVIEVVCGVQFEPLTKFTSVHYGEFRPLIIGDYPHIEEQTPIAEIFENREPHVQAIAEALEMPPLRRVFYVDRTGNFLLQLQPSRFLTNWRKRLEADEYPRFRATYGRFLTNWDIFQRFAQESGIGTPITNQYELTYINHVVGPDEGFPAAIEFFLPLLSWSNARSLRFLSAPSSVSMRLRFPLPEQRGTLHLKVDHGKRMTDGKDVLLLEFTARGPAAPDWSDMKQWFTMAHEQIVVGFTDLTSREAQQHWGKLARPDQRINNRA